jgi:hypothetical protein
MRYGIAIVLCLLLSASCSKDRTCLCIISGVDTAVEHYEDARMGSARRACQKVQNKLELKYETPANCELK